MVNMWALAVLWLASGQVLFDNPESVVYDAKKDRYLVSNCGDGRIIQVNTIDENEDPQTPSPIFDTFNSDLSSIRGMHIMGNTLYVGSDSGVVGFDLDTGKMVMMVEIHEALFLNDVVSDGDQNLYVSDSDGDQIFKVDPKNLSYTILVSGGIDYPNGLLYDAEKNRLIVCTGKINAPIYGVDPSTGIVTQIIKSTISYLDGMAYDSLGNIYITSWFSNSVYRYDHDFSLPPVKVSKEHKGPADLCYNAKDNLLAIPNFKANRIDYLKLEPYAAASGK